MEQRGDRGLTLLELMATLGLAALVATIGALGLADLHAGFRLAGTARSLASSLRLARGWALARGERIAVRFDPAAGAWRVVANADGSPLADGRLSPPVTFATLPARARITFDALGAAENGTITLAAGGRARRIVVNQRGRVRLP